MQTKYKIEHKYLSKFFYRSFQWENKVIISEYSSAVAEEKKIDTNSYQVIMNMVGNQRREQLNSRICTKSWKREKNECKMEILFQLIETTKVLPGYYVSVNTIIPRIKFTNFGRELLL